MKPSLAMREAMELLEEDEAGVIEYVRRQEGFFNTLPERHTPFDWWIAFKLQTTKAKARQLIAKAKEGKKA